MVAVAGVRRAVLIVDDEETVRNLLSTIVLRIGGAPVVADTSARARALLPEHEWDCVILDKNLPDGSGMKLLASVREEHPKTAVLMITGYANMESAIQAVRLGAFDYIVKPFDVATISYRIRQALDRRQMERDLEAAQEDLRRANAQLGESREEVKRAYLETVLLLAKAAETHDAAAASGDHGARVSRYAGLLARALSATEPWVEMIVQAAPLHDIGMIGIPDGPVKTHGPLTEAERRRLESHVDIGAKILQGATASVLVLAREVVLTHHERWDGEGYPRGLAGPAIPLSGRVVAVADAWDALTTDRPYRRAVTEEQALDEIRAGAGTQFDPNVVDAFFDVLPLIKAAR
ncbi:MAG TPA: HD domain-containing phosphohydrolase [Haliangiales bacterium]|nr:HD domain-containing phosphohydrolase [Haliangiales bacterium]